MDEKENTLAAIHLFSFNEKTQQLDGENREIFHSLVAKISNIMRRAIPDLEIAIPFLCRRVSKIDVDYWKNLRECCRG